MNKSHFYQYIHYPELLDERSLLDIEKIIAEYPYFQSAHLLHVKNLSNQGNVSYDRELKRSAIWVTNRKKLFYLLDKRVLLSVDSTYPKDSKGKEDVENVQIIDFTELTGATSFNSKPIEEPKEDDELSKLIIQGAAQSANHFGVSDKLDLVDFKRTFGKKKDKTLKEEPKRGKKEHRRDLIDNFIIEQPKIEPRTVKRSYERPLNGGLTGDELPMITDTLAKIYIKQEKYDKAILAYEKLSLKYPEKNSYFASQIYKIKQLINNK